MVAMVLDGDGHTVKECSNRWSIVVVLVVSNIPSRTMTTIEIGFRGVGSAHVILVALSESCILLTLAVDL